MMRLNQKIRQGLLLTLCLGPAIRLSAQNTFKYVALINKADATGFYKISLPPNILVKGKDDLSDVRLMDQTGMFIPYITVNNLPEVERKTFIIFPKVSAIADSTATLIIENTEKRELDKLWVQLKNTAVTRTINLSGSDDLKKWYAIEENIPLQQTIESSAGSFLQSLLFPASNYKYFKLSVNGKNKIPVKLLEAGIYFQKQRHTFYTSVPVTWTMRKDTNKVTTVMIHLNDSYLVNKLRLFTSWPKYYQRNVALYKIDKQGHHLVCNAKINSNNQRDIFMSAKSNELQLQIKNGDNSPLVIDSIKVFQADQYLVSYLEKDKNYKLYIGDVTAKAPEYDLKSFIDSIQIIHPIGIGPIIKNEAYRKSPNVLNPDYSKLIWVAIILALAVLSILTIYVTKEIDQRVGK